MSRHAFSAIRKSSLGKLNIYLIANYSFEIKRITKQLCDKIPNFYEIIIILYKFNAGHELECIFIGTCGM